MYELYLRKFDLFLARLLKKRAAVLPCTVSTCSYGKLGPLPFCLFVRGGGGLILKILLLCLRVLLLCLRILP